MIWNKLLNKIISFLTRLEIKSTKISGIENPWETYTNKLQKYRSYKIGDFTYGLPEIFSWDQGTNLEIGKFCSIANGVKIILGGEHNLKNLSTYPFKTIRETWNNTDIPYDNNFDNVVCDGFSKGDVIIGNDVWIGMDAIIMSGVTIGHGSVIGARTVVTKDVEPYSIVIGNPGKTIRKRFDDDVIELLLNIKWWDWSPDKINEFKSELIKPFDIKLISSLNKFDFHDK